jgi:hypothetical protein
MLAAVMVRGGLTNRKDLIADGHTTVGNPWTVPAGVTSFRVVASGRGGLCANDIASGVTGGGAGGGAGWIVGCSFAVTAGDLLYLQFEGQSGSVPDIWILRRNGAAVFSMQSGFSLAGNSILGGNGGECIWYPGGTATAAAGIGGGAPGDSGTAGATTIAAGGTIGGGGGGGAGNTATPLLNGGNGGASGSYLGQTAVSYWGAAGAGVQPGQQRLGVSLVSARPNAFCFLEW